MPSPTNVPASIPERLADVEGELPEEIEKAICAFERATGVLSSDSRDYSKLRVAPWDAARAALTATILARLTAAESAREAAAAERDAFREKLAETCGRLMVAEGSASKLRVEREHTDLRIRAQRARLRELEPCVGGAVATDGGVRLLQFARKKAAECRSLRRAGDAALARAEKAEKALEPFAEHGRLYAGWLRKGTAPCPRREDFEAARAALAHPATAEET